MLEIEGRRPELVPAERIKKAAQQSLTAPQVPEMITSEVSSDMRHIEQSKAIRDERITYEVSYDMRHIEQSKARRDEMITSEASSHMRHMEGNETKRDGME